MTIALFGLVFIALRVALVAWLLWRALVANSSLGNPTGLMLFSFAGVHILVGQLTMSGMGAIFGWLFAGFILAATSPWSRPDQGAAPAVGRSPKRSARQRGRPPVLRGATAPDTEPRLR